MHLMVYASDDILNVGPNPGRTTGYVPEAM